LRSDIKQHQTRLCVPKVVCQSFATSIAADYHCAREALLNKRCLVDWNNLIDRINNHIGIGWRKEVAHCPSREHEVAVVIGKAHNEVSGRATGRGLSGSTAGGELQIISGLLQDAASSLC